MGPYNSADIPNDYEEANHLVIIHDWLGGLYLIDLDNGGKRTQILAKHLPPKEFQTNHDGEFELERENMENSLGTNSGDEVEKNWTQRF